MLGKFCIFFILGIITVCQILIYLFYSKKVFFEHQAANTVTGLKTLTNISTQVPQSSNNSLPEVIYNEDDLEKLIRKAGKDKKFPPKSEFDFLLRLRKLVLFSVRETNLRIRGQECAHWWANPLFVSRVKEVTVSQDVTQYSLTFEIQPGRIPFLTVVNVSRQGSGNGEHFRYEPEELVFVDGGRLDPLPTTCGTVPSSLHKICLCPEEVVKAERETKEARIEWELDEVELNSWPPNSSMMVPDYITFGRMNFYLNFPVGNAEFCGPNVKMILFVSTYPDNFKVRKVVRQTYGNPKFLKEQRVKVLFVFDRVSDSKLQGKIDEESRTFDDIIQGSHVHSYHNLTLRDLSMFNWIVTHCRLKGSPLPRWTIKTDDDYFINIPLALEVAAVNRDIEAMGVQNCRQPVVRDPSGQTKFRTPKYYTPKYIHSPEYYAGYLSGASWLIRSDVLPSLLKASLTMPFVPADDVYIMGMLTREVGIRPRNLRQMTYGRHAGPCETKLMINSNTMNHSDMYAHWAYFRQPRPKDCKLDRNRRIQMETTKLDEGTIGSCFFTP